MYASAGTTEESGHESWRGLPEALFELGWEFEALRLLLRAYGGDLQGIQRFTASFLEWEASHDNQDLALQTLRILAGHRHPDGTVIRLSEQAFQHALRLMVENVGRGVNERRQLLKSMLSTAATEVSADHTPKALEAPAPTPPPAALQGLERLKADLARLQAQSPQLFERKGPERAEAREWLTTNGHPHALALNKFWQGNAQSLAFVSALYDAGAVEVVVDNIRYGDVKREGGPWSDTLIRPEPRSTRGCEKLDSVRSTAGHPTLLRGLFLANDDE